MWYRFTSLGHELLLKTSSLWSTDSPTDAIGTPEVEERHKLFSAAHTKTCFSLKSTQPSAKSSFHCMFKIVSRENAMVKKRGEKKNGRSWWGAGVWNRTGGGGREENLVWSFLIRSRPVLSTVEPFTRWPHSGERQCRRGRRLSFLCSSLLFFLSLFRPLYEPSASL